CPPSPRSGTVIGGLGRSPADDEASPASSHSREFAPPAFGVWFGLVGGEPPRRSSALPPMATSRGWPKNHFGENQLSPGSLGMSPLPTAHPRLLQQTSVRPSTRSYPRFSLAMGSSPGFGSTARDSPRPLQTRFRSGSGCPYLSLATNGHSPVHSPIGTPSGSSRPPLTVWRHTVSGSLSLPSPGCFSPVPHGTCPLSVAWGI